MKKLKITLFIVMVGLLLFSCKRDITEPTISSNPTAPVLANLTIGTDFNADNAGSLISINWTKADYGFSASVNYSIEMDVVGDNFANAVNLASSYTSKASISVQDLNTKLLGLGLEPETTANLELRLKSNVNDNIEDIYSNTVSFNVSPYRAQIYMIGDALGGWELDKAVKVPVIGKDVFQTTTKFTNGGHFRFFPKQDWSASWGYDYFTGSVSDLISQATSDSDPNYVFTGISGLYKITVNLNNKSIALEFISAVEQKYPAEVFLVGNMNGWDNNGLYMAALKNDVHVAYQYLDSSSEFKILIKRGSWDGAWGRGANPGEIADGGDNIVVSSQSTFTSAGFYEIRIDFPNATVVLTPITTMGVIGDAQAGGWDTDVDLTYNQSTKMWEGQVPFFATGQYKFRANHAWAINFGGTLDNLVQDGANIDTPGAGTYNVKLNLGGATSFSATVTK